SPSIVFDDCDVDGAVAGALYGIYYNAGQTCEARSRILLQSTIFEKFVAAFSEKSGKLRVGDPEDPQTHVGAITMREQLDKIKSYCDIGAFEGAKAIFGGAPPAMGGAFADGMFWSPTAFEAERHHRIAREEIFGPVVTFVRFESEADAIAIANDSD